jgi:hypothetical protein
MSAEANLLGEPTSHPAETIGADSSISFLVILASFPSIDLPYSKNCRIIEGDVFRGSLGYEKTMFIAKSMIIRYVQIQIKEAKRLAFFFILNQKTK